MGTHILPEGTLLDGGRYRIGKSIGQGGFGITYIAQKVCLEQTVAIKELYWLGHSQRDAGVCRDVRITAEAEAFDMHKERFVREARILRDYTHLPGVVHIDDYFEENGTAYIVMEYVRGQTLAKHLKSEGKMPAQQVLELFLPLAQSLSKIHENGVIHRDISPDNIMVMPDGSLKLIDFGAARDVGKEGVGHSVVVKAGYAPFEQYSRDGVQGAWTDVYALCATMYHCVTGEAPVDSITRAYAEKKLPRPAEKGVKIKPKYEAIIMRGLEMDHKKRYERTELLARAIREALPGKRPVREMLLGFGAGLLCLALVVGGMLYREYDRANRFRNVVTETFYLTAPSDLTAAEFAAAQKALDERLTAFAGEDNYLVHVEGAKLRVQLPLALFNGEEISGVIREQFASLVEGKAFGVNFQSHVNWEDPNTSMTPGENQVAASALEGDTGVFVYTWSSSEELTLGERAHLIVDFKVRLDALDTPYAFGTLYGDENLLAFRMDPERLNAFVLGSLGDRSLSIVAENESTSIYLSCDGSSEVSAMFEGGETVGVVYTPEAQYKVEDVLKLVERAKRSGEEYLYLQDSDGNAIAQAQVDSVGADGMVQFAFRLEEPGAQRTYMAQYIDAMLNDTTLPVLCFHVASEMLDGQGNSLFTEVGEADLGAQVPDKPGDEALLELVREMIQETGYRGYQDDDGTIWIHMGLDADEHLPQDLPQAVDAVLKNHAFRDMIINASVIFVAVDEQDAERCRIILDGAWDEESGQYVREIRILVNKAGRIGPLEAALNAWWDTFDPSPYGLQKRSWYWL